MLNDQLPINSEVSLENVCQLCSLPVSRGSLVAHVREVVGRALKGEGAWLLTLNTEMIARGLREPDYLQLLHGADIITADGMPVVWASGVKFPGAGISGRTTGVDLVDALLRLDAVPRFAVIGGHTPSRTIAAYGQKATDACVYVYDGRVEFSEGQIDLFCEELSERGAQVVFIALGVPKQDQLAALLRRRLPHLVLLGVGGSFEILGPAGFRAPRWMQALGLEWLFRLYKEPRRLWKRYLVNYPRGVWFLLQDCLFTSG